VVATSGETDAQGSATFHLAKAGQYTLSAVKEGFQPLTKSDLEIAPGLATVELILAERVNQHQTIDVEASVPPVEQGASTPTKLVAGSGARASQPARQRSRSPAAGAGSGEETGRRHPDFGLRRTSQLADR
jgi:hypothetical protein